MKWFAEVQAALAKPRVCAALKALNALVILGLAASVAGLALEARANYAEVNRLRGDPLELEIYSTEITPEEVNALQRPLVMFYGDSRAADWKSPELKNAGSVVNRGIGGQTTDQCMLRMDFHLMPYKPDIVVLQVGVNDLKIIPLDKQKGEEVVGRVEENLQTMVNQLRASGAKVIVTTIFPAGDPPLFRAPVWSPEIHRAIKQVNEYILKMGDGDQVTIWDVYPLLSTPNDRLRPEMARDFLHLNKTGYDYLSEILDEKIKALIA
ncbi:MAG TPA: SGNH/GDSL hydrolase family protein, partial [Thermoflexales bacterium]|nr:SGNH/GDSL hydrolase family protein [Thermoflexales bacterium]